MNGWYVVEPFVHHLQFSRFLQPSLFEPVEQQILAVALGQSARYYLAGEVVLLVGEVHAACFEQFEFLLAWEWGAQWEVIFCECLYFLFFDLHHVFYVLCLF